MVYELSAYEGGTQIGRPSNTDQLRERFTLSVTVTKALSGRLGRISRMSDKLILSEIKLTALGVVRRLSC